MATSENNDLSDKKWNSEQNPNTENEKNEGFSGENIPADYNPAPLKTEKDVDSKGKVHNVDRARHEDASTNHKQNKTDSSTEKGNEVIEDPKLVQHRDRNYDHASNRYPASHPENKENRGNINLDQ